MATQTANVIDLAAYREQRARRQASADKPEPLASPVMGLPFPLLSAFPGYWLFWVPVLLPYSFAPSGALLDAR